MRITRIARPDALYGASVSARTSETIEESIINPIDPDEVVDANLVRAKNTGKYSRMPGNYEYGRKFKKGVREANRANLSMGRQVGKSKTHCEFQNLLYLEKRLTN